MRVIADIKNFPDELANSCIALGNFDGVHLGHQEIIRAVKQKAREMGVPAGIVTFWPHPRDVLAHDHPHKYIMTKAQKLQALEELGLDFVLLIDFDIELSKQSHEDFISALKAQTRFQHLHTGYNFRFGNKGKGDTDYLANVSRKLNFSFTRINNIFFQEHDLSTTFVKHLLKSARLMLANKAMGRNFSISGTVIEGQKNAGSILNTKTANILIPAFQSTPHFGVYVTAANIGDTRLAAITNIGVRPTASDLNQCVMETHILNFDQNIYGHELNVEFLAFVRPERKFKSFQELSYAIKQDLNSASYYFRNLPIA